MLNVESELETIEESTRFPFARANLLFMNYFKKLLFTRDEDIPI